MSGETATPRQSGYIVTRGERMAIRGWRKTMDEIAAFYFTSLGDSYASRTGRPDNVGVIGVALFKRKPQYDPQPWSNALPEPFGETRQKRSEKPMGDSSRESRGQSLESHAPSVAPDSGCGGASWAIGSTSVNTLPPPGFPETSTRPPWARMIC